MNFKASAQAHKKIIKQTFKKCQRLKVDNHYYHYLCDLLWIITIEIKSEGHHFSVVRFQLALCNSVSHIRDL